MTRLLTLLTLCLAAPIAARQSPPPPAAPAPFHWHDDYTEYHLLAPGSGQFHIVYFLNQRQAGLAYVLNQTRSGSAGSDISVSDPRTGAPLKFDYKTGKELADEGVPGRLAPEEHYIRAHLTRPVPAGGEGRVRIEKTYADEKSYSQSGDTITFARSLGIGRNAVVLPQGFKLAASNVAAMVDSVDGGRVRLSFENVNGYASDVSIRAVKGASGQFTGGGPTPASTYEKTLYELDGAGTIAFRHEAVKDGRQGRVSVAPVFETADARATDIDSGLPLKMTRGHVVLDGTPATAHVRVTGSMRDAELAVRGDTLTWSRTFTEPRATIVLPAGYALSRVSTPVTAGTLPDGRAYLQLVNSRPGAVVTLALQAWKAQ
ncbi:MAG: hypothetical protein M3R55_16440 [Acidobacteriota bacterium]|nr:hypothetical protein [Acidobacteriota bacterium]